MGELMNLINTFTELLSDGLDIFETMLCVSFLAAVVLLCLIFSKATTAIVTRSVDAIENIVMSIFGGIKKVLKKMSEFDKED